MTRFIFLTDTHYYPDAPKDYGAPKMLTKGAEIHEAVIPAINALKPDFVLHGGDLLCGGSSFDLPMTTFERSIAEVSECFGRIEAPFYCVPGNHDCDAQTWAFDAFNQAFSSPSVLEVDRISESLRVARANVFLGDTRKKGRGEWTDRHDQLLREADKAAKADSTPMILCLHTWLLPDGPTESGEDGRGCVEGSRQLLATISECSSIVAVFTGHRHLNRITAYRDFLIVDTASVIGYPFGFREITLSDDGWFHTRFHQLHVPDVVDAYRLREDAGEDGHWAGQPHDSNCDILIPRLKDLA